MFLYIALRISLKNNPVVFNHRVVTLQGVADKPEVVFNHRVVTLQGVADKLETVVRSSLWGSEVERKLSRLSTTTKHRWSHDFV